MTSNFLLDPFKHTNMPYYNIQVPKIIQIQSKINLTKLFKDNNKRSSLLKITN